MFSKNMKALISIIIFILTVQLSAQVEGERVDLDLTLPNFDDMPKIEVMISEKGQCSIANVEFSIEQISVFLKHMRALNPEILVNLKADKELRIDKIVKLIGSLRKLGVYNISFSTM